MTHGLSGKIGDLLVFRQRSGQTIVSKTPTVGNKVTEAQQAHRRRFQQAVFYGKAAMATPELSEQYGTVAHKKKRTVFNIAVADFLRAPDIEQIDFSAYTGQTGDVIRIRVTDDFAVKSVHVRIANADGSLVEEGAAVPDAAAYEWTYTATQDNKSLDGDRITVLASDRPGNLTQEDISM